MDSPCPKKLTEYYEQVFIENMKNEVGLYLKGIMHSI